ncbi:MAG: hypothetical protein QOI59_5960 [Gammaproteobacteria bacterium]|jgi:hypothetical protein|nr:hypothetical protein [Gammaproteobacteria bacterium]
MDTIVLTLDEAEQSLAGLIRQMRAHRGYVVVKDCEGPLAYLTLAVRPEDWKDTDSRAFNGRPGQRMVTSEEIYEELRNSLP